MAFGISKDASGCIKGLAVLLMVLAHYWGNRVFTANSMPGLTPSNEITVVYLKYD